MKSISNKQIVGIAVVLFALLVVFAHSARFATAAVIDSETGLSTNWSHFYHYEMTSATTTQATSTAVSIAGAEKVQAYFNYNDGSGTATSTFYIEVSPNGIDWYDFNKLISNVANANSQTVTRVASLQAVGTTSAMYALDLESDTFDQARCIVTFASTTITAADNSTCELSVEF